MESMILIIFAALLTITHLTTSNAVDVCPVKVSCDCSHVVDCYQRNLTELPLMIKTVKQFSHVSFKRNFITRVEDGYFSNLAILSNTLIIDLSYNRIDCISSRAFEGLENVNLDLHLEHNNIVALPTALVPLNNLRSLGISGVHTYGPEIVKHISKTLTTLRVGDFSEWSEGLKLFNNIESVYLFELRMSKISAADLASLAYSLESVTIQDSSFQESLHGLCSLRKIRSIQLINLTSPIGVELIPRCQSPITSVNHLMVDNAYIKNLSTVQETMPGLSTLNLNLPSLNNLTLPANNNLESVYLLSTLLKKLPASPGRLESLKYLDVFNSKISSIKREDLRNYPNLRQLLIVNSSLTSISEGAFENNPLLENIYISGSNMTYIPKAITRLPNIYMLSFYDSPIKCSCDMAWLLGWSRFLKVILTGHCGRSGPSLSSYTKYYLRGCAQNPMVG